MARNQEHTRRCGCCDYLRLVKTLGECGAGVARSVDIDTNIRDATVCVQPDSPYYGERRRRNAKACTTYADWCWDWDFDGDVNAARAEQALFVTRYRRERLRLKASYEGNGGAGGAPYR